MAKVRVHPIQLDYRVKMRDVVCGLCNRATPRTSAPPRVTHLVHLVREHLADVERANSAAGLAEETTVEIND